MRATRTWPLTTKNNLKYSSCCRTAMDDKEHSHLPSQNAYYPHADPYNKKTALSIRYTVG